ncbi:MULTISPECIES: sensor histidine kinase [unclassified Streptomyces]|uniref:sensor histidine kinase n=1 Tax=unclassified Streptomyces TaxID=2593676 RepID=UPI0006AE0852|nr:MULTISPECIES: ATP-binding protein [unclassified Streptomyces]KOX30469.1 membrane protein [Streptomyces sp. NRRL F-6491]KOX46071.1 membrane protein [Streptomyces sp. NRRL F-6492]
MSQLRAPASRSDRREGGRHGRPGARSATGNGSNPTPQSPAPLPVEVRIRPQLLRTSVLPAVAVALGGAAAVLFTIRSTGAAPTPGLWAALTGAAALTVASVAAAALGADRAAKAVLDRCNALRRTSARGQSELRAIVEQLRRGEGVPPRPAPPAASTTGDEFDLLSQELTRSHEASVAAVVQASRLSSSVGNEQKVEVFVNLARRLQSLVHREIQLLDELENEVEDPELLKGLFHVDHLATRIRRHAENLAVLGGAISRRQWSNPVTMTEVLRSSIAEVEQYPRVKLVPPIDGTLRGHAVADVIHLLAELVENATLFSAPHTTVLLRAQYVTAGLAIEVEDRGLGMPAAEQNKMNALLSDPDQVNVSHLLQDGRIGLFVVSALARRHGIAVRLQSNIYGGVQAVLVLPQGLLGADPEGLAQHERQAAATAGSSAIPPGQVQLQPQPAVAAPQTAPAHAPAPSPGHVPDPRHPAPVPARVPPHQAPSPLVPSHPQAPVPALPDGAATPHAPASSPFPERTAVRHEETPANGSHAYPRTTGPHGGYGDTGRTPAVPDRPADTAHPGPPPSLVSPLPPAPAAEDNGRPLLPKRRAQEHLVPQLREEPVVRRTEEHALHDPGLMAAFQRGIGLAESQPAPHESPRPGDPHKE